MRFHTYKWNKMNREYTMIVLTEHDIVNESDEWCGAGFEIVIMPAKYKDISNNYLDTIRLIANTRRGEIIYI